MKSDAKVRAAQMAKMMEDHYRRDMSFLYELERGNVDAAVAVAEGHSYDEFHDPLAAEDTKRLTS